MYPVTDAVKALYAAEQRQFLRITGTDKNGVAINITDANVVLGSFNIDRYSCNGNRLEVGTAIAAEMTVKLDNHDGTYNGIVFEGTELFVEIGIGDPVNWMPCGYFTPDEQPRTANQITIHALDRMVKFDNSVPGLLPWTTETGEIVTNEQDQAIYFMTDLAYPATIQSIITTVCGYYHVPFTQDISSFPNYNYTISEAPNLQQTTTFRNIIQWCAGIMGTCAWIDWTGSLRFSWYGATTGYVSTPANRFSSDLSEDDVEITGVQYTNLENYTVLAGRPEYTIDMTGNYLMAGNVTQILTTVNNRLNGYTYRPFSATIINAPYLWPMDSITFTGKDGNDYTCVLTNVNFGINGAMSIEGKGESMQAASRDALSGMTKEQGVLVEQAREATQQLDNSLTQEEIFNRLTANGAEQGLILYNGKLYLNAEYIQAGTVAANLLMAAILTIGGANNGNGSIRILDGNGNVIGTWNKDGINVSKGTIAGPSVTLGGNNNESGTLTVKDGSGNVIGTWSKDGIVINDGTIIANAIKGGTLTLGGLNNISGVMKVLSGSGGVIGSWNSDGINVSKGDISLAYESRIKCNTDASGTYFTKIDSNGFEINTENNRITTNNRNQYSGYVEPYKPNGITLIYLKSALQASTGEYHTNIDPVSVTISREVYVSSSTKQVKNYVDINLRSITLFDYNYSSVDDYRLFSVDIYDHRLFFSGNMAIKGTKSRVAQTDQYSDRLLYCYETPSPMFGDVGEGTIGEDGKCYVWLDPVFAQTITTTQYQVFLQRYGSGECWVSERKGNYFVVEGTPGMAFGWEIKAKQKDFDQRRLDRNDEPFTVPTQTYGADAAQYINDLKKERTSA